MVSKLAAMLLAFADERHRLGAYNYQSYMLNAQNERKKE